MKQPSLLFFFLLITCFSIAQTSSNWTIQNSGTNQALRDVSFTDNLNGWVVGDAGTLLHTTNGGDNWTAVPFPDSLSALRSVAFSSPDTGYVINGNSTPYFTHDGGATWAQNTNLGVNCFMEKVRIAPDGQVYFIYFGCFEAGRILSWNPITGDTTDVSTIYDMGFSYNDSLMDIDFPEAGTAVAVGNEGMILRTSNNGDTWSVIAPPDSNLQFVAVDFIDADTGFAVTNDNFNPQWKTTDGGLTWFLDPDWDPTFFYPVWSDIEYLPSGFGLLAGATLNMGLVFQRNYFGGSETFTDSLFAVDAVQDSLAWVVGNNGIIARLGSPLLSIDEKKQLPFSIYPNPSSGTIAVKCEALRSETGIIRLHNPQGQLIGSWELLPFGGQNSGPINLGDIAPGLYFLELQTGTQTGISKLLVR